MNYTERSVSSQVAAADSCPPGPTPGRPLCRHCRRKNVSIRHGASVHGLCWTCYKTPSVRTLYPLARTRYRPDLDRGGLADFYGAAAAPAAPTNALPGTPEKIAVLEERAAASRALWHPRDSVTDDEGRRRAIA